MALGCLVDVGGTAEVDLEPTRLRHALARGDYLWLDVGGPREADLRGVQEAFGFHELAIEDSLTWGQRPKLEEYDDFVFLVVYGWAPDEDGLVEVHCYYSPRFLVTVHRDQAPALEDVRPRAERVLARGEDPILVLHQVVDALVDSFAPPLERMDDRLEQIEDELLARPSDRQMQEILAMRRHLAHLRKAIAPQRDLFGGVLGGVVELPGMTREAERYFRDVYDHLFRLAEMTDAYRDLITGTIDVYLSTASNRLGAVTKQLTLIATIFLPLTFVSGFFGQNFRWMVDHIDSWPAFVGLGIGLQLATIGLVVAYFRRHGWF
ncbi:MAG: magnesium transporter CorA family protein [Actinomycetota bacterium]|nr:magnesium transporter CorA family protein [Actinomycetota bacterium]